MRISVTERGTFKRCRRQWDFASYNRQGLQRVVNSVALNVGTMHHKTMEAWVNAETSGNADFDPVDYYQSIAVEALTQITDHYIKRVGVRPQHSELVKFYDAVTIGQQMIINYRDYWGSPIEKGFTVVAMEQTCLVPIPHTEHVCLSCLSSGNLKGTVCSACDGTGFVQHELEFTLDGLVQDSLHRLYVVERKTYGARPNPHTLKHNDQFIAYLWGVQQLGMGTPVGIAYDGAWKRHEPPRGKVMSDLFLRCLLERSQYEIEQFEHRLVAEAFDMANDPLIYTNRRWEGCHDCAFVPLCDAIDLGDDVDFIRAQSFTQRERTPAFVVHEAYAEVD
jgi:hypothetical protein